MVLSLSHTAATAAALCVLAGPTLVVLGAADKFNAGEDVDATREKHRKGLECHVSGATGTVGSAVPTVKFPTPGLVVDVVEEASLGHQQGI